MIFTPAQGAHRLSQSAIDSGFRPEALHPYTNEKGEALFWRIRLKNPQTGEKWIRPMMRNGNYFVMGEPSFPEGKPLYRLHELVRRSTEPVVLVEGERCADVLAGIGVLATTSGSADSAEKADWKPLANRRVVIWPDHDPAGTRYADESRAKLSALGCEVQVIDVTSLALPPKGDCVDWLAAHPNATAEDVWRLAVIAEAEPEPAPEPSPIERLATLSEYEYDQVRRAEAKKLGVRVNLLDAEVQRARRGGEKHEPTELYPVVVPSTAAVEPARLLSEIRETIREFIVCEPETTVAATLWIAFTWFVDHVSVAPLAVITAPEKRCGKSQLLTLIGHLSRRPITASNITPAALYRVIETHRPTLLIDEADTFLHDNEELRGVINSGHTRQSAFVVRTAGEDHAPARFSTWGAKALSGIGVLADTMMDRAVVLSLRRKLPGESVERLRHADAVRFERLASQLARFEADAGAAIARARPSLPAELHDRAQDNWEPLLAIADRAGGEWPALARAAAVKVSARKEEAVSTSVELLADVREILEAGKLDRISSAELLRKLVSNPGKPWATFHRNQPLTARMLGLRLSEFGIHSASLRFDEGSLRGYFTVHFEEAFARYLPPLGPPPESSVQVRQDDSSIDNHSGFPVALALQHKRDTSGTSATDVEAVALGRTWQNTSATEKSFETSGCRTSTDDSGEMSGGWVIIDV